MTSDSSSEMIALRSFHNHWSAGVRELWPCIRSLLIASHAFIALFLTAAESSAADKLRISYASVTGNNAGLPISPSAPDCSRNRDSMSS
jgi:hypothetical protein